MADDLVSVNMPDGTVLRFPSTMSQADMQSAAATWWAQNGTPPAETDDAGREVVNVSQGDGESLEDYRARVMAMIREGKRPVAQVSDRVAQENAAIEEDLRLPEEQQSTSLREQGMNGVNEGIAGTLGFPVDTMTGAMNLGINGVNWAAGTDIPEIESGFGGSKTFTAPMQAAGAITDADPQTAWQRYARSIGRDGGASVIPVGVMARGVRGAGNLARLGVTELLSSIGSGVGAQAAQDVFPESGVAPTIGGLLGGGFPIAASYGARARPQAPSIDGLLARQQAAYDRVRSSGAQVTPEYGEGLRDALQSRIAAEGVPEFLPTSVRSVGSKMDALPPDAMVTDIEDLRRRIGRDLAGSADPQTSRIGVELKSEIDAMLQQMQPSDVIAGDPTRVFNDLLEGRELTGRLARADLLGGETGAVTRAIRRASTSGTGGNEVNAIRQNIRAILDSPAKRRGFSADEIAQMERIVEGTKAGNALRLVGRLSPTAGALPAMAGVGSGFAAATTNPLFAVPPVAGLLAQGAAERMSRNQVLRLDELVRNGAPLAGKTMADYERAVSAGLLSAVASGSMQ